MTSIPNALEAIRARLAAATPGPWSTVEDTYRAVPMHRIGSEANGADVAQVMWWSRKPDAEFIANAPTDIAHLLAALHAIQEPAVIAEALCEMNGTEKRLASVPVVQIHNAIAAALGGGA